MAHKIVDKQTIEDYRGTVAYWETLIANVKKVSSGGRDSIEAGMDAIRELEFDAGVNKDSFLKRGDEASAGAARRFLGMQEAYQNVITMFEKPDAMIQKYDAFRREAQKRLDELKELEQREPAEQ